MQCLEPIIALLYVAHMIQRHFFFVISKASIFEQRGTVYRGFIEIDAWAEVPITYPQKLKGLSTLLSSSLIITISYHAAVNQVSLSELSHTTTYSDAPFAHQIIHFKVRLSIGQYTWVGMPVRGTIKHIYYTPPTTVYQSHHEILTKWCPFRGFQGATGLWRPLPDTTKQWKNFMTTMHTRNEAGQAA